jgi:hypothetical protein
MQNMSDRNRYRRGIFRRWVDYPTLLIASGWVGLLCLFPDMPITDSDSMPHLRGGVVVMDGSSPVELYRRPDLIAFSSPVSFITDYAEMDPAEALLYPREAQSHNLPREHGSGTYSSDSSGVALAAEAIRDIGQTLVPFLLNPSERDVFTKRSPIAVAVSLGLGINTLAWTERDVEKLFQGDRTWEVEISLTITDDGRPEYIFIERGSRDVRLDQDIVQVLSRPDVWTGARPGRGAVLISFSPVNLNGGTNAH